MRGLLRGERICLAAIKKDDAPLLEEWFNDVGFLRHYDTVAAVPKTLAEVESILDHYASSDESRVFGIRLLSTGDLIGLAGFDEIIWTNGTATVFIGIGPLAARQKGFGKEAIDLLLDFGFNELNFHKLQLTVIEYNEPAIRLYENAGFTREGTYREFIYRDGKRYGLFLYGLLRREWEARHN